MVKVRVHHNPKQVKKALKAKGITYGQVARIADVTWHMVYLTINRRKKSARIMDIIFRLIGNGRVAA